MRQSLHTEKRVHRRAVEDKAQEEALAKLAENLSTVMLTFEVDRLTLL